MAGYEYVYYRREDFILDKAKLLAMYERGGHARRRERGKEMIATAFSWLVFIGAALVAIVASLLMVTRRNPVHSALWLIVAFFSLAIIYLSLNAQFIAVAQVIVYAGAIMMLILFVIMLIHLETEQEQTSKITGAKIIASFITIILFLEIVAAVLSFKVTGTERSFYA